jgi:hypothetical protein
MQNQTDNSIFYRQNALPQRVARTLTYEAGFALGGQAGAGDLSLAGLLLDACVLATRHESVAEAARLMHVAEAGLRGFLAGAGAEADRMTDMAWERVPNAHTPAGRLIAMGREGAEGRESA